MTHPFEPFIRQTLGCGCPDEVFQHIEVTHRAAVPGRPALVEIDVGGRLLVRLIAWNTPTPAQLAALLEAGRRDRDARGFNRFRLAIAAAHPKGLDAVARETLERATSLDEKVHLHVVAASDAAGLLP